jgi:DNA-binding response OmpR family regulator
VAVKQILIIEDNQELAFGLQNNLEIEGYGVSVAADGGSGLSAALAGGHDLVILDLMLPDLDGFRVLKAIRSAGMTVPVLILTARGDESDKVRGLKLGADDYVTKPFSLLEFLARTEALLRRSGRERELQSFGDIAVDPAARVVLRAGKIVPLAPKEFDLLVALMANQDRVMTRLELIREVWGYDDSAVTRTVDTHIAELRRKLEDNPKSPRHILTVPKAGYRLQR